MTEWGKTRSAARITVVGMVGLLLGFMVVRSIPEIIRYVKICRP